jgi:Restriction endonuclease
MIKRSIPQLRRFPNHDQLAGMLLEEAVLCLLEASGYTPVTEILHDSTLHLGRNGLEVQGRGGRHQIDAIADFAVQQPFIHPQRLLVEAKCQRDPIGIEVMRNAVGVLQDVDKYWDYERRQEIESRYSYQYAVLSASDFTDNAKTYALVHGIYLIPLEGLPFIRPILEELKKLPCSRTGNFVNQQRFRQALLLFHLPDLRRAVRSAIRDGDMTSISQIVDGPMLDHLIRFCNACRQLNKPLLAIIARRFPVFLIPEQGTNLEEIYNCNIEIHWYDTTWYIQLPNHQRFFFSLPTTILKQYLSEENVLSELRALDLKADYFSKVQVMTKKRDQVRIVTWNLDMWWLDSVRSQVRREKRA